MFSQERSLLLLMFVCPPVVQHVGGLWRRDGPDVLPHGLGLKEAGEGVSHDQQ